MNTETLENAIKFALEECWYQMSECRNEKTWEILERVENLLKQAANELPF